MVGLLNSRYAISPDVLIQQVADSAVLLDFRSETYFGLDAVGLRVWQDIARGADLEATVAALLAEYEVDEPTLRGDLEQHVAALLDRGLILRQPG